MDSEEPEPAEYVIGRLLDVLAHDPRVSEQGFEVTISGRRVTVRGEVATPARRDAVLCVAREVLPESEVVDDLRVSPETVSIEPEAL